MKIQNAKLFFISPLSTPKPSHHRSILKLLSVGCSLYGVENRCKSRVGKVGCFAVVGADCLALVAAENPAVEVATFALATTLDCGARNTARGVYMSLFYSTIRASIHASSALSATHRFEWFVVLVALGSHHHLAQQHECAELGRYEQRLSPYPTQARIDGITLLEDGRTIHKTASREGGINLFESLGEVEQHLLYGGVVVGGAGVGCDLCRVVGRVALAYRIFVGYGTHNHALCTLHEEVCIGSALDVPFEILQRGGVATLYPPFEEGSIILELTILRHSAEVEPNLVCQLLYLR